MIKKTLLLVTITMALAVMTVTGLARVVHAAEISGTVITVDGNSVTIKISLGSVPSIGDKVELSFILADEKFLVGIWRVTRVVGATVYAKALKAELPAEVGMMATILYASAKTKRIPIVKQQPKATSQPIKKQKSVSTANKAGGVSKPEVLPWLEPKSQASRKRASKGSGPLGPLAAKPAKRPVVKVKAQPIVTHPTIDTMTTQKYDIVWDDSGSGADEDFASFRPRPERGYYPLGDVAVASPWRGKRYAMPAFTTVLVKSGSMEVKKPVGYKRIWSSEGSNSDRPFSSWEPVPPAGYKCLGDVGSNSFDEMPSTNAIRCLPVQCVKATNIGNKIWADRGSGAIIDFTAWRVPQVNLYIGIPAHAKPRGTIFTFDQDCREHH